VNISIDLVINYTRIIGNIQKSDGIQMFCGREAHWHELSDSLVKTIIGAFPVNKFADIYTTSLIPYESANI